MATSASKRPVLASASHRSERPASATQKLAVTPPKTLPGDRYLQQLPIIPAGRVPDVPVLMYHDVVPRKEVWFDETTDEFARELREIHDRRLHPISSFELWEHLTNGKPLPSRPIVLTFDDANEGQFRYALPLLRRFGYPATFFIHTGYVGVTTSKRHMTWDELRQAESTGLIEVEGRTVTHPCDMPDLTAAQLDRELQGGIAAVREHLGHGSLFFSYPCGHTNQRAQEAVRRAGYLMAYDEERGFANRSPSIFAVQRFAPKRFEEAVRGAGK